MASQRIRAATKVEDGWAMLKRQGIGAVPHGEQAAAAESLVGRLAEAGCSS